MIPDDACTALVDLLQSLETFELSHLHRLQCSTDNIPKELWKGIGSSCTLKSCVLDGFSWFDSAIFGCWFREE